MMDVEENVALFLDVALNIDATSRNVESNVQRYSSVVDEIDVNEPSRKKRVGTHNQYIHKSTVNEFLFLNEDDFATRCAHASVDKRW